MLEFINNYYFNIGAIAGIISFISFSIMGINQLLYIKGEASPTDVTYFILLITIISIGCVAIWPAVLILASLHGISLLILKLVKYRESNI
jgi:hypothetical protein